MAGVDTAVVANVDADDGSGGGSGVVGVATAAAAVTAGLAMVVRVDGVAVTPPVAMILLSPDAPIAPERVDSIQVSLHRLHISFIC